MRLIKVSVLVQHTIALISTDEETALRDIHRNPAGFFGEFCDELVDIVDIKSEELPNEMESTNNLVYLDDYRNKEPT